MHPVGTEIYIPSKSPFEKGRLRGPSFYPPIPKNKRIAKNAILPFPELNPRLELGTPSLRVKCSTTELIQPEAI